MNDELDRNRSAAEVLTAAFLDDPVMTWLITEPADRPAMLGLVLGAFLRDGEVRTVAPAGRIRAVAVWDRPDRPGEPPMQPPPEQPPATVLPHLERAAELDRLLADRHPGGIRHRYLRVIGVRPADRGRGHGGALLRQGLAECDAAGLPAYLEATSQRNAALYARHGFRPHGAPIRLPGGPDLYPMWRDPAPRTDDRTEQLP